jgi:hypothetical protein
MAFIQSILLALRTFWMGLPAWLAKGLRDAVVAAVLAVLALNLVLPANFEQAKAEGLLIVMAAGAAVFAVFRVEILPNIIPWILGVSKSEILAEHAAATLTAANKAR